MPSKSKTQLELNQCVVLIDTNVLFATASARDTYHDTAREIIHDIDHGTLPEPIVTDYVVAETLNCTGVKLGPSAGTQLLDRLVQGTHFESIILQKRISTPHRRYTVGTMDSPLSIRSSQPGCSDGRSSSCTPSTTISTLSTT
jgi:hypothetical protein